MPTSRKRRSTANHAARRRNRRRKAVARFNNMMLVVSAGVARKARETGHRFCAYQCPAGFHTEYDSAGYPQRVQDFVDCGGRLKPFRIGGKVVSDMVRCNRCGRDQVLVKPELEAAPCHICAGTQKIEYRNAEGTEYSEPCPDCTASEASAVLPEPGTGNEVPETLAADLRTRTSDVVGTQPAISPHQTS